MLKKFSEEQKAYKMPESLAGDPVANRTEWRPLKQGGANFKTSTLKQISDQRIEIRASLGMILFSCTFILMGLAVAYFMLQKVNFATADFWTADILLPVGFGIVFPAAGILMISSSSVPVVLDKNHGYFIRGFKKPERMTNITMLKNYTALDNVHALQKVSQLCGGGEGGNYYSYELNLVLKDGARLNILAHGHIDSMNADSAVLSQFLNLPVWESLR